MSIRYLKPIDLGTLKNEIEVRIGTAHRDFDFYTVVLAVFQKHDGKALNKRIVGYVKDALDVHGDYIVTYDKNATLHKLVIWGEGIPYSDRITFYLGSTWDVNTISAVEFEKHNQWAAAESGRATRLEGLLAETVTLERAVKDWNQLLTELQSISEWATQFESPVSSFFDINR